MKRFITAIALCLVCAASFGQINSNVKVIKNKTERIIFCHSFYSYVERSTIDSSYYIVIKSDNEYENKIIRIKLGNNENELIQSLYNVHTIWDNQRGKEESFDLCGHTCYVLNNKIMISNPEHTAGTFWINAAEINDTARQLEIEYEKNGCIKSLKEKTGRTDKENEVESEKVKEILKRLR